jgi:hypothetical protein
MPLRRALSTTGANRLPTGPSRMTMRCTPWCTPRFDKHMVLQGCSDPVWALRPYMLEVPQGPGQRRVCAFLQTFHVFERRARLTRNARTCAARATPWLPTRDERRTAQDGLPSSAVGCGASGQSRVAPRPGIIVRW